MTCNLCQRPRGPHQLARHLGTGLGVCFGAPPGQEPCGGSSGPRAAYAQLAELVESFARNRLATIADTSACSRPTTPPATSAT